MSHSRTAIVTSAGSGIGRRVALALCREGYTVALAITVGQAVPDVLAD